MMDGVASNLGKFFSYVFGNKVMQYFNIPSNMMGMTQMALEDLWVNVVSYNFTLPSIEGLPNLGSLIPNNSMTYVFVIILVYLLRYIPRLLRLLGVTNNYYTAMLGNYWRTKCKREYSSIISNALNMTMIVNKHLVEHDLFVDEYPLLKSFEHIYASLPKNGSDNYDVFKNLYIPSTGRRYYFNDTHTNTKGYLSWTSIDTSVCCKTYGVSKNASGGNQEFREEKVFATKIPHLNLTIDRPVDDFITKINELSMKISQQWNCHFSQRHKKGHTSVTIDKLLYIGDFRAYFAREHAERLESCWIKTFFHPSIKEIWPKLKTIHFSPDSFEKLGQYPQACYCLYGPPGTGKSSLAYRVARALGRAILSIKISDFRHSHQLMEYITAQVEDRVFVLDEFDRCIFRLMDRKNMKNKRATLRMNRLSSYSRFIDDMITRESIGSEHRSNDDQPSSLPSYKSTNGDITTRSDGDVSDVLAKANDIVNDNNDDDELTVDSLLDIIQGSYAVNGRIIFAITNKYDELRRISPRLFRDGRFKPVYIGYPTRDVIDDVCEHYFGAPLGIECPEIVRIPTARIVNRAVDLVMCYPNDSQKQLEMFRDHLLFDLENYTLADSYEEYEKCIDTDLTSSAVSWSPINPDQISRDESC